MGADIDDENKGFLRKYGVAIIVALGAGAGVFAIASSVSGGKPPRPPAPPAPLMLSPELLPPPPPPPPPPKPEEPKEESKDEPKESKQEVLTETDPTPAPPEAPAPAGPPPDDLGGSSITGDGANNFGLQGSRVGTGGGGGNGATLGGGGTGGGGSRFGWYASRVQSEVTSAFLANKSLRGAVLDIEVRVWADAAGKITMSRLSKSTGDAKLDAAIRDEVLGNMTLSQPPPEGMPMPIRMAVSARRP